MLPTIRMSLPMTMVKANTPTWALDTLPDINISKISAFEPLLHRSTLIYCIPSPSNKPQSVINISASKSVTQVLNDCDCFPFLFIVNLDSDV